MKHDQAWKEIDQEYFKALQEFDKFHSPHEGLAVILAEFEELKTEVFLRPVVRSKESMTEEAVHLAAMAFRFLVDLC